MRIIFLFRKIRVVSPNLNEFSSTDVCISLFASLVEGCCSIVWSTVRSQARRVSVCLKIQKFGNPAAAGCPKSPFLFPTLNPCPSRPMGGGDPRSMVFYSRIFPIWFPCAAGACRGPAAPHRGALLVPQVPRQVLRPALRRRHPNLTPRAHCFPPKIDSFPIGIPPDSPPLIKDARSTPRMVPPPAVDPKSGRVLCPVQWRGDRPAGRRSSASSRASPPFPVGRLLR